MEQEAENGAAVKVVAFTAMKPRLYVEAQKAKDAVEFYKTAFGAEEVSRIMQTKRKAEQEFPLLLAAELKLGSSSILVSDVLADDSAAPVKALEGGSVFCLETHDVEGAVEKAVAAGAISEGVTEEDGDRAEKLKDPFGNVWLICSPADVVET